MYKCLHEMICFCDILTISPCIDKGVTCVPCVKRKIMIICLLCVQEVFCLNLANCCAGWAYKCMYWLPEGKEELINKDGNFRFTQTSENDFQAKCSSLVAVTSCL